MFPDRWCMATRHMSVGYTPDRGFRQVYIVAFLCFFGGTIYMAEFRSGGFQRRDFGGPREMHKATCSKCGKECEVPFKPTQGKPVYCKDCYVKPKRF